MIAMVMKSAQAAADVAGKVADHKTTRAAARVGVGIYVASVVLAYWQPPADIIEETRWLIVLGVNEGAYLLKGFLRRKLVGG